MTDWRDKYTQERFGRLIGSTIERVEILDDGDSIVFHTNKGPMKYVADGDCCSHTWIEGIDDSEALLGTVTGVEELSLPSGAPNKYGHYEEAMQYYGLKITTEKGRAVIEYRNSSNGYYGGSLEPA